ARANLDGVIQMIVGYGGRSFCEEWFGDIPVLVVIAHQQFVDLRVLSTPQRVMRNTGNTRERIQAIRFSLKANNCPVPKHRLTDIACSFLTDSISPAAPRNK